jgi:hypothetical protein
VQAFVAERPKECWYQLRQRVSLDGYSQSLNWSKDVPLPFRTSSTIARAENGKPEEKGAKRDIV